jgi:hypothetical protein
MSVLGYVKLVHVPPPGHELYGKTGSVFEVEWGDETKKRFIMRNRPRQGDWVMVTSQGVRWFVEAGPPEVSCI